MRLRKVLGLGVMAVLLAAGCALLGEPKAEPVYPQDLEARAAEAAAEAAYESPEYCPTCGDAEVNDAWKGVE